MTTTGVVAVNVMFGVSFSTLIETVVFDGLYVALPSYLTVNEFVPPDKSSFILLIPLLFVVAFAIILLFLSKTVILALDIALLSAVLIVTLMLVLPTFLFTTVDVSFVFVFLDVILVVVVALL